MKEGGRKGGREGEEEGSEGGREGGRKGGREEGREGGRRGRDTKGSGGERREGRHNLLSLNLKLTWYSCPRNTHMESPHSC